MNQDCFSDHLVDRRRDDRTAIEIDRALCLRRYFGLWYGATYLFHKGVALPVALRVLAGGRCRIRESHYLPLPEALPDKSPRD